MSEQENQDELHTGLIILSQEQLRKRRDEILFTLGLSYKEYVLKEMHDGLEGRELDYSEELAAIDFFLKEEDN